MLWCGVSPSALDMPACTHVWEVRFRFEFRLQYLHIGSWNRIWIHENAFENVCKILTILPQHLECVHKIEYFPPLVYGLIIHIDPDFRECLTCYHLLAILLPSSCRSSLFPELQIKWFTTLCFFYYVHYVLSFIINADIWKKVLNIKKKLKWWTIVKVMKNRFSVSKRISLWFPPSPTLDQVVLSCSSLSVLMVTSSNETFFALLAICAGNSSVTRHTHHDVTVMC